jgi:uncharacterized protein
MEEIVAIFFREIYRIFEYVVGAFIHTWPLWVTSIPLAAAIKMSSLSGKLKSVISMKPVAAIFLATVFGSVSPLCSCSVIPVIFSLLTAGVPIAPVMSFWLASPSMDPEIFLMSVSNLGGPLAIARLLAATLMSLGGGFLALVLEKKGWFSTGILRNSEKISGSSCGCIGSKKNLASRKTPRYTVNMPSSSLRFVPVPPSGESASRSENCCSSEGSQSSKDYRKLGLRFGHELLSSLVFVAKFMAIAFVLEAVIKFYVPEVWIRTALGAENIFAIPIAVLVGIPFYTTNAQALGMIGGLLAKGMSEGAALSFLIGGATTTLPAMSAVYGIAKPRVFAVYLGSAVVGAFASGVIWSVFF